MKNSVIIAIIVIIAVVIVGALAALNLFQAPASADNKTQLTANGSKVTVINNNPDVWAHWELELQNAPQKNGTQQTYHIQLYIKPGENATFDLSNILGYGEEALPQDTNITVLGYGGLYNTTAGGHGKFNTTLVGWTVNQTIPSPPETYNNVSNTLDIDPIQPIGALPTNVTDNLVTIGTEAGQTNPEDQLFAQFNIIIGANGVPYFELREPPVLCEVIAGQ